MPRIVYAPEIRRDALAALLAGQSVAEVAVRFAVATTTVRTWKRRYLPALQPPPCVTEEQRIEFGQRVLEFLQEEIDALRAQAKHFKDPGWLAAQNAHDLAVLHGLCIDKTVTLLQAIESPNDGPEADGGGSGADGRL